MGTCYLSHEVRLSNYVDHDYVFAMVSDDVCGDDILRESDDGTDVQEK